MRLGIFAKIFERPTLREVFSSVREHKFGCVQFNFSCVGRPTLPQEIELDFAQNIFSELNRCHLTMAAISGTCNLINPRIEQRASDLAKLEKLIRLCPELGTSVVTLCSGSRDPDDMWNGHPDNRSGDAWRDLARSLAQLLPVAEERGIALAIEPEPANVIDTAISARKLLDQMRSPCLKTVFDAANLARSRILDQRTVLSKAFELLHADIAIAHAKDLGTDSGGQARAETGALDYNLYLSILKKSGFNGPLIVHGITENEVDAAARFLVETWENC